jgi:deoxycytidine triphosphate deaminase
MANEAQPTLFGSRPPGVLQAEEMRQLVETGWLVQRGFEEKYLESCSYDLRVGNKGLLGGTSRIIDLATDVLDLAPGAYGGVVSHERVRLPKWVCGRIGSKRAFSYEGIILLTGTIVDPGYEGYLLFGIYNASPHKFPIRIGQKIANIVFERLEKEVKTGSIPDPRLSVGDFPDDFVRAMDRMEVEPLMQIGERVGQLRRELEETIKHVGDLRSRYENVLEPIKKLTENVNRVTADVDKLTQNVSLLSTQSSKLDAVVAQNNQQITQLATDLGTLTRQLTTVEVGTRSLSDAKGKSESRIVELETKFNTFRIAIQIFWALVLLGAGITAKWAFDHFK